MRKIKSFFFLIVLFFGPRAFAQISVVALCEAALSDALKPYATDGGNPLYNLRGLRFQVEEKIPTGKRVKKISPEDFRFTGGFKDLKPEMAARISLRIARVEEALERQDPSMQLVIREIRGKEAISQARDRFAESFNRAVSIHAEMEGRIKNERPDIIDKRRALRAVHYGILIGANFLSYAAFHADAPVLGSILGLFTFSYDWLSIKVFLKNVEMRYDLGPFDWTMKALSDLLSQDSGSDALSVSSKFLLLPTAFHHALFSGEPSELEQERMGAYLISSGMANLVAHFSPPYPAGQFESMTRAAGDFMRFAFLDQFMYFDKETNEPVWIMAYRAYRPKPLNRRPPRRRAASAEREESYDGAGVLEPSR